MTSSRHIGDTSNGRFRPFEGLGFAGFVAGHLLVARIQILTNDVRTDEFLDKPTDPPPTDDGIQPGINTCIQGDGHFLSHDDIAGNTCHRGLAPTPYATSFSTTLP